MFSDEHVKNNPTGIDGQHQHHNSANNNMPAPSFGSTMENITVIKGRDASFTCVVLNIGPHRVAWIKADDKGILAMHDRVLTNNARLSVLHSDLHTWTLHIRDVHRSDRGVYMCQINSDPMLSQTASLEVVIPPDILNEEGGGEVLIPEGGMARLSCKARGFPQPRVTWRREDGQDIVIRSGSLQKQKVPIFEGEVLTFHKITRSEMGAYLCIASNNVPPSVSRRIVVNVHFYPIIQVHNQLVGGPLGSNITLDCMVEASPKPINYWARESGEIIIPNDKYRMEEIDVNTYTTRLRLHLRLSTSADEGGYKCCSKNSIGDSEGTITVYGKLYSTKRVEEEKPLSRWSDHDDDGGAEEPDTVDDADNTSLEMTTSSHYSYGKATHPGGGASSRRSNNNNNNVQSPTQNKMSIIRSSGTAVRLQRSYYHLVAITSFFLVVYTLL
uniref:Ig-like domain-containing protein n=1 Tax=Daphnia galeata TaxID=27404 RepID=A0A8J2R9N4_9CRUS|nr:unnamed protein product [Daphnia galeata]